MRLTEYPFSAICERDVGNIETDNKKDTRRNFFKHINIYVNIPVLYKEQVLYKNFLVEEIIAATCEIATASKKRKQIFNNA
jgi:hypothetical protein